jgi:hypothetical protein
VGSTWGEYTLTLSIIRPTGLMVIERSYESRDELSHGTTGR